MKAPRLLPGDTYGKQDNIILLTNFVVVVRGAAAAAAAAAGSRLIGTRAALIHSQLPQVRAMLHHAEHQTPPGNALQWRHCRPDQVKLAVGAHDAAISAARHVPKGVVSASRSGGCIVGALVWLSCSNTRYRSAALQWRRYIVGLQPDIVVLGLERVKTAHHLHFQP
jgi:hypothetical protein